MPEWEVFWLLVVAWLGSLVMLCRTRKLGWLGVMSLVTVAMFVVWFLYVVGVYQ